MRLFLNHQPVPALAKHETCENRKTETCYWTGTRSVLTLPFHRTTYIGNDINEILDKHQEPVKVLINHCPWEEKAFVKTQRRTTEVCTSDNKFRSILRKNAPTPTPVQLWMGEAQLYSPHEYCEY